MLDNISHIKRYFQAQLIWNKRLQVAYTHAHAYMSALVPQGSQYYFSVLYIPDVTIAYVTLVVAACAVMNQSRYLQPEV